MARRVAVALTLLAGISCLCFAEVDRSRRRVLDAIPDLCRRVHHAAQGGVQDPVRAAQPPRRGALSRRELCTVLAIAPLTFPLVLAACKGEGPGGHGAAKPNKRTPPSYTKLVKADPKLGDICLRDGSVALLEGAPIASTQLVAQGVPFRLHADSPRMHELVYGQIDEPCKAFVQEHLDWILFAPDVRRQNNHPALGLYLGNRTVVLDSVADDGAHYPLGVHPSCLGHEAEHSHHESERLHTLIREKRGEERALVFLDAQVRTSGASPLLDALRARLKQRLATIGALEAAGKAFWGVYPDHIVLAGALLQSRVRGRGLAQIADAKPGGSPAAAELWAAAKIAQQAREVLRDKGNEGAIRAVHSLLANPSFGGSLGAELGRLNWASVLSYLAPDAVVPQATADISAQGMHWSLSPPGASDRRQGEVVGGAAGYGVSGLPDLESVLNNRPLKAQLPVKRRRVSSSCQALNDSGAIGPDRKPDQVAAQMGLSRGEGRPHPRFVRCVVQPVGRERFEVFYATNCIRKTFSDGRETILGKIDTYRVADGTFVSSRYGWLRFEETGVDLEVNLQQFARVLREKRGRR